MDESPDPYAAPPVCPAPLLASEMPDWHKLVWLVVRKVQGRGPWAYASLTHYGDRCGKDKSQVSRAISALVGSGWVERSDADPRKLRCNVPTVDEGATLTVDEGATLDAQPLTRVQRPVDEGATVVDEGATPSESLQGILVLNPLTPSRARGGSGDGSGWAVAMWRERFPASKLPLNLMVLLDAKATDPDALGEALDYWRDNDYRPTSIGRILSKHDELLTPKREPDSPSRRPRQAQGYAAEHPTPGRYDALVDR